MGRQIRSLIILFLLFCPSAWAGFQFNPHTGKLDIVSVPQVSKDITATICSDGNAPGNGSIIKHNGTIWDCGTDNQSAGGGNSISVSEDGTEVANNRSSDIEINYTSGFDFSGSGQVWDLDLDPSEKLADRTNDGFIGMRSMISIDVLVAASHDAVTVTGEDFLSLSSQQITANAINPDNLASADFGDFTCNGTNCSLDADVVSNDELAPQSVSTDQIQAFNKPTDGQILAYDAGTLQGEWVTNTHTTDTGPSPDCSGTSTYQDGEGGCDTVGGDVSGGLDNLAVTDDSHAHGTTTISGILAADMGDSDHGDVSWSSNVATVENVQCTDCISGTEIPDDQIDSEHYVANSIDAEHYANDSVSNDALATQAVSTDQLQASNKPTDGQCFAYEADTLGGIWTSCGSGSGDNISIDGSAVVDPDFVSTGDIDFVDTSNTVTANINADAVSNDELAPQSVSTDQLQAANLPSDGQVFSYSTDFSPPRGEWINAAAGGGDSITVDGSAIDTTAAFASTGDIDFVFADGGGGGPDDVTANINADAVSNDELAPQSVSTDQLQAINTPTDGQVFSYSTDVSPPRGEWITSSGTDTNSPKLYYYPAPALLPMEHAADSIPPIAKETGNNVDILTRDFNDSARECVTGNLQVPNDLDTSGTITLRYYWTAFDDPTSCSTSCEVAWDFGHRPVANDESWDGAGLTLVSADVSSTSTSHGDVMLASDTVTVSTAGWVANDIVFFEVCRAGDGSTDDLSGDAQLHGFSAEVPRA